MSIAAIERAAEAAWSSSERTMMGEWVLSALHSFGESGGVEQAYSQVVEENDAAVDLYRSLGYEMSHRYWYRRAAAEGS